MSTVMTARSNSSNNVSGSVKKMIRDTTRLLNRPNLPADLRREQERKLAALQVALADREKAECEREMSVKYRMVRFFERKKALRRLAAAQAKGEATAIAEAQLDLAYILHFPKDRKYISLYPSVESSNTEVLAERAAIRKEISEKLALLGAETMLAKAKVDAKKMKMNLKGSDDEESDDDDDDDDEDDSDDEDDDDESDDEDDEEDSEEEDDDEEEDEEEDDEDIDESDDEDNEDFDSEDEDDELSYDEEDSDDDEDDEEDSDEDDDEDSDDEDDDSEEEDDEEEDSDSAPAAKKRRH